MILITSIEAQKELSMKLLKYQLGVGFDQPVMLTDSLPELLNREILNTSLFLSLM